MFFRFLVNMSILVALLYSALLLQHIFLMDYSYTQLCPGLFSTPCFLYYSRFDARSSNYYSITLILFAVVGTMVTIYEWV